MVECYSNTLQDPRSWIPLLFLNLALLLGFGFKNRKAAVVLAIVGWHAALMCALCRLFTSYGHIGHPPPPGEMAWGSVIFAVFPLVPAIVLTIPLFFMEAAELPRDWLPPVRHAVGGVLVAALDFLVIILSTTWILMEDVLYPGPVAPPGP